MEKEGQLDQAWSVLSVTLTETFTNQKIISIVSLAGIPSSTVSHHFERTPKLRSAIDNYWRGLDQAKKKTFIAIVAEEMLKRKADLRPLLENNLSRLGLSLIGHNVIPVEILDASAIAELPSESRDDMIKAAQRLRDGDLSGAVSAACGAVNDVTEKVYADYNLADFSKASFQEAFSVSIEKKKVIASLEEQLRALNWAEEDIKKLSGNFKGALNQGANVMQTLRVKMGDVHGTKPVLKPLVFDSIKWAEIMLRSLAENDEK